MAALLEQGIFTSFCGSREEDSRGNSGGASSRADLCGEPGGIECAFAVAEDEDAGCVDFGALGEPGDGGTRRIVV